MRLTWFDATDIAAEPEPVMSAPIDVTPASERQLARLL